MPVVIESPYAGNVAENVAYAEVLTLALAGLGFGAYASHPHMTHVLDDTVPAHRDLGIQIGLDIASALDGAVFGIDLGWSTGMQGAALRHQTARLACAQVSARALHFGVSWRHSAAQIKTMLAHHEHASYILQQLGFALEVVQFDDWSGEPVEVGRDLGSLFRTGEKPLC